MRTSRRLALTAALTLAAAAAGAACSDGGAPAGDGGAGLRVEVAPLTLEGVTNARYRVQVETADGDPIADVTLSADAYGDGQGAISYVAPCDPEGNDNVVSVTLLGLYRGAEGTEEIPPSDYANPAPVGSPVSRPARCVANADTAVAFDLVIMRRAVQGFFDIGVAFEDVFCSAKLDCDTTLLHAPGGERGRTLVVGLACTGGLGESEDTVLYLDDVRVACDGGTAEVDVAAGPGNVAPTVVAGVSPLFGAAVYRGREAFSGFDKRYWNVALGFSGGTNCTLTTSATASSGAFDPARTTPSGATWPVISWRVPITTGAAVTCSEHPLDGAPVGVASGYLVPPATHVFSASWPEVAGFEVHDGARRWTDGTYPTSCAGYLAASAPVGHEGVPGDDPADTTAYWIDPDAAGPTAPFATLCDMGADGGGWTLVGMVHRADADGVDEPVDWFALGQNAGDLVTGAVVTNRSPAGLGVAAFDDIVADGATLARLSLTAANDAALTVSWFKRVTVANLLTWFRATEATATQTCTDAAMTAGCETAAFTLDASPVYVMRGLELADFGYTAGQSPIHMRENGQQHPAYSGVCSSTLEGSWPDTYQQHWGNALRIWIR